MAVAAAERVAEARERAARAAEGREAASAQEPPWASIPVGTGHPCTSVTGTDATKVFFGFPSLLDFVRYPYTDDYINILHSFFPSYLVLKFFSFSEEFL